MHILEIACNSGARPLLIADLWERGTSGIIEEELAGGQWRLRAFFDGRFDAAGLWACASHWEEAPDRDWVEVAREQWHAVPAGKRFFLVPSWSDEPVPPGRLRLEMRPGRACGTGWHAATQLALQALETALGPGCAVLDLGTGSGILAVAAYMLGAKQVFACDIDPEAVVEAKERLRREAPAALVFAGSLRSVRPASIDLLVANINAETLIALAGDISGVLKPGGTRVLSGFPRRHLERVQAAFGPPRQVFEKDGWVAVVC
jgi:ribosomal protein L11 methyltransferase